MKRSILFFFKYFLFWFLFFVIFKVLFLLANISMTSKLDMGTILSIFLHGSIMDLSAAGYLTLIPGVLLVLTPLINNRVLAGIIKWYTFIILFFVTILGLTDIALYPVWGTRVNGQLIPYLAEPAGIIASVSIIQGVLFALLTGIIITAAVIAYNRIFRNELSGKRERWFAAPVILFLTAALIIPIRGGVNTSPLNFSSVYFHRDIYPNHAAYNFFWSFNHALMHQKDKTNPVNYYKGNEFEKHLRGIDSLNQEEIPSYINNKSGKPVNVILVILESFSDKVIEPLGGLKEITPELNSLSSEGILFSEFYASGTRSDKGISSLIAMYPSLIKVSSIVLYPEKMKKLNYLPGFFGEKGYDLSFYYGGDPNFYNTNMLLTQSGVNRVVSRNDFPLSQATMQKWGVPDAYLYDKVIEDLAGLDKPFFSIVYTVSSHEPFDIPQFKRIKENSSTGKYCNAVAYADSCLGAFVNKLKATPEWDNTLLIITADHAALEPGPTSFADTATYRIPLLWLGGVIDSAFVCDKLSMQSDLGSTLIQQMGWEPEPSYFSKNIFGSRNYACYLHDEGWGLLTPEGGYFMNIKSDTQTWLYGKESGYADSLTTFGKSYVQYLHNDFMSK